MSAYSAYPTDQTPMGLSYSDLAISWFRWLVSEDPDKNNDGPVYYLRGMDFAPPGADVDHYYSFVRLGKNKLKVPAKRPIFWPIIFYYLSELHYPNLTEQQMYRLLRKWMEAGDNPPSADQATIDGNRIQNFPGTLIVTPIFELNIPDADATYKKTLAPLFTDEPFKVPGTYKCIAGGYFVLLKGLEARDDPYTIVSHGRGELNYITDTVVEVLVQSMELSSLLKAPGAGNKAAEAQVTNLVERLESHDLTPEKKKKIVGYIRQSHELDPNPSQSNSGNPTTVMRNKDASRSTSRKSKV